MLVSCVVVYDCEVTFLYVSVDMFKRVGYFMVLIFV